MAKIDESYKELVEAVEKGFIYDDPNRDGIKRIQIQDYKWEHDFKDGFPASTTKEIYYKGAVGEVLAFLKGSTSICALWGFGIRFWDKDFMNYHNYTEKDVKELYKSWKVGLANSEDEEYSLGKIYPYQLRSWNGEVDQIQNLIDTLLSNPMATKKTVTMWNPSLVNQEDLALTQCHFMFQILTRPLSEVERYEVKDSKFPIDTCDLDTKEKLDRYNIPNYAFKLKWHQHSVDTFLGLPINIMYYSILAEILGRFCNMIPEGVIGDLSNVHIYTDHLDAIEKQKGNSTSTYGPSKLVFSEKAEELIKLGDLDKFLGEISPKDIQLENYKSYPAISAEMLPYSKK